MATKKSNTKILSKEIDKARSEIKTDGYPISIGEWLSIYEKSEMDIHPEFQRYFRWSPKQKSSLIESLLLGIPIPPIFVAQRKDGIWDIVDGLQRLSTIFEFVGILKGEDGNPIPPLVLESTKYLPSLEGTTWDQSNSLDMAHKLAIKRSKIDVSIIQKESDENIKYELFQRLNTGGSVLSNQELRNSILVMLNRDFFNWLQSLSQDQNFLECVGLSDRLIEERYDLELVLRFLCFRRTPEDGLKRIGDLSDYLTARTEEFARDKKFNRKIEEDAFRQTFAILNAALGTDAFRRYDNTKGKFLGGFSVSAFEAAAIGIAYNISTFKKKPQSIVSAVQNLWSNQEFSKYSKSGFNAESRLVRIIPLGRKLFK